MLTSEPSSKVYNRARTWPLPANRWIVTLAATATLNDANHSDVRLQIFAPQIAGGAGSERPTLLIMSSMCRSTWYMTDYSILTVA